MWEFEIISLLHKGIGNMGIANTLSIAKRTVETHVYRIYQKLEIKNRYELIALIENSRVDMPGKSMTPKNQTGFFNKIHKQLKRTGNLDSLADIENS
jgi:DNA-binding CsgD family transcriptional regulator